MTLAERFQARVNKNGAMHPELGQCWEWAGPLKPTGYGELSVGAKNRFVHRLAWELATGNHPGELCVLHRCDNRACVRPDHLFLGTKGDNNRDAREKGRSRWVSGERQGAAKLTAKQVEELRTLYATGGFSQRQLAANFGISQTQTWKIVNRLQWKSP